MPDASSRCVLRPSHWILAIAIGCGTAPETLRSTAEVHVERAPQESRYSGRFRYHMRNHANDLGDVQALVAAGKLADARALAFILSSPAPGIMWSIDAARVRGAALALTDADTLDSASARTADLAMACARCHRRLGARLLQEPPPEPEPQKHHSWALARLLEGVVAESDLRWRAGLEVLVAPSRSAAPTSRRLQQLARSALVRMPRATLQERGTTYGEILATCASCHATAR